MAVLVGRKAPDFSAKAVINGGEIVDDYSLSQFKGNKYVLLFFYPKDFTFVCPTELHAFQSKLADFEAKNTQVIAVSTDQEHSHWTWLQLPKDRGGIQGIKYPLVADTNKTIARAYDVLAGEFDVAKDGQYVAKGDLVALRGLFLIDKDGIVQHQLVNNDSLGRSVDEALRMVDALQFHEQHGQVCPANWNKEAKGLETSHDGIAEYLTSN